jgi:hypothetical protein
LEKFFSNSGAFGEVRQMSHQLDQVAPGHASQIRRKAGEDDRIEIQKLPLIRPIKHSNYDDLLVHDHHRIQGLSTFVSILSFLTFGTISFLFSIVRVGCQLFCPLLSFCVPARCAF